MKKYSTFFISALVMLFAFTACNDNNNVNTEQYSNTAYPDIYLFHESADMGTSSEDYGSLTAAEYLEMIGHWEPGHWDFLTSSFKLLD
ncbi:MAG: hypothetical protein FWF78_07075 [Defluviitaleaceae bacterium]|nr:hypothetical protein [Defluviitaleaceae bacterium]